MDTPVATLICPNCKKQISIDEALKSQLEGKIRQSLRDEYNEKWQNLQKQQDEKNKKEKLELEERLEKQKKEIDTFRENELALRKKTLDLEEKEKNLELEKQRQIDEERKKIQEKTETEVTEKFYLKEKEKDQLIESLKKSLDEAQRKASVGSQQLQGEVMELELEEILKREFPIDEVLPVKKGVKGADVVQRIRDRTGREVGKIVWESKRTKAFKADWIEELKENMREEKSDIAVLVTLVLPVEVNLFGFKDGVYIASFEAFLQIANILRKSILDLSVTKALSVGKNEKIEALYSYITSPEFGQKIDSMLETYSKMRLNLNKEKMFMQRQWAEKEKEIETLQNNTLTMHGSLSGLIEEPLSQVKSLEFEEIEVLVEETETNDNK
ncbi:hypothetical protein A3C26_03040 [Candidatus Daviesbacteria bacterium RIFCSPHIGHO2_02_FULL_39_12]|uniref:DUF2130 domain-containing protein n=2 Tax=Candidatus Daviesiibacteriota TaxID=1752718 RepID=A0A1F5JE19_9BACT|nr:MAG: hypothetical protein A3C26_03040 [Candidatus Daviesbacteria bacterium RIFCSPHIGHO2_02_FULL_39_12]OGE71439.1 MAG: hypothetical protein A3H40_02840 [Candidatus Daviesbacteria bacterium RIFCSPLOWO2_02_FULL_38_15]